MNSSASWGGSNFRSVSRGDVEYSKSPPTIRTARLSINALTGPSSRMLPISPSGLAALGIWKPMRWNCSPKLLSRGGRVWQTLHCTSYCRANAGTASADSTCTYPISAAASAAAASERLSMLLPLDDGDERPVKRERPVGSEPRPERRGLRGNGGAV